MYEMIQNNWILALAFFPAFGIIMGLIAKFVNKDKLLKVTVPPAKALAVAVSVFLKRQLGEKAANKFENGLIITVCYVMRITIQEFEKKLISDNAKP